MTSEIGIENLHVSWFEDSYLISFDEACDTFISFFVFQNNLGVYINSLLFSKNHTSLYNSRNTNMNHI